MMIRRGFQNDPNSAIFSKTNDDTLSHIYPENELGRCTHGPCSERHLLNNILKRMSLFTQAQKEAPMKRMPSGGCKFGACVTREEYQRNPHPDQRNIVPCVDGTCNYRAQQDQVKMNARNTSPGGCSSGNCNTKHAENNKPIMVPSPCGMYACNTTNSPRERNFNVKLNLETTQESKQDLPSDCDFEGCTEHHDKRISNNTPCGFGSCGKWDFKGTKRLEGSKHNDKRTPFLPGPCGFRPCVKKD